MELEKFLTTLVACFFWACLFSGILIGPFLIIGSVMQFRTRKGDSRKTDPSASALTAFFSALLAVTIMVVVSILANYLLIQNQSSYATGIFIFTPFMLGVVGSLIYQLDGPKSKRSCVGVAGIATLLSYIILLTLYWEGIICLLMASPLVFGCVCIGALVGNWVRKVRGRVSLNSCAFLLLSIPGVAHVEYLLPNEPKVSSVESVIMTDQNPDELWETLTSERRYPPPSGLLFELGLSYPLKTGLLERDQKLVFLVEYADGAIEAPAQVLIPGRALRFQINQFPKAMKKITLVGEVKPEKIARYIKVLDGTITIEPHEGGSRVVAQTRYESRVWPEWYWSLWNSYIFDQVHRTVLEVIIDSSKNLSNGEFNS